MKQFISRISIVLLLLAVCFGSSTAVAQYRHRGYNAPRHYRSRSGDNVVRGIYTAQAIGQAAQMGYALHTMADYTGLRLGYNSASLRFSDSQYNLDPTSGVNVGIVFGWYLGNSPFILEPGVLYSKKGGKFSGHDGEYFTQKVNMHMLEFPCVLKVDLASPSGLFRIQPFAGAYMGFGMGGQIKDSMDGNWDTFDTYDNFDAGFRYGCGLSMANAYFEVAYDYGLTNMENNNHSGDVHTKTFSLNVGINF